MEKRREAAFYQIADEVKSAIIQLEKDPLKKAYALIRADDRIRDLVTSNYSDIPDAVFLQFFYNNIRYHLWMHVAADASLRLSDETTENIINAIKIGLNRLVDGLERNDKTKIYDALVELTSGYLAELNKGGVS